LENFPTDWEEDRKGDRRTEREVGGQEERWKYGNRTVGERRSETVLQPSLFRGPYNDNKTERQDKWKDEENCVIEETLNRCVE
jgi:hypothetical protein